MQLAGLFNNMHCGELLWLSEALLYHTSMYVMMRLPLISVRCISSMAESSEMSENTAMKMQPPTQPMYAWQWHCSGKCSVR